MKKLICTFAFLTASLLTGTAHAQIITTVAGGGTSYIGDGGPATDCVLSSPSGIVFDAAGNYYIADRENNRIRKVATDGTITTIAGTGIATYSGDNGSASAAELNGPYGIAMDAAGNIYFSDDGNARIRKINRAGIITTIAGTGVNGYNGDNIPATNAELFNPSGIVIDNSGNVFVGDYRNSRVRKISASGIITTVAGTGTAGYNGNGISATDAELYGPNWLTFDPSGNLYIVDDSNNCVRKIDTTGIITAFAGDTASGYSGDNGPATNAKLKLPCGVYADSFGNVYIDDTYNNVVRKVDVAGIITTIAGCDTPGYSGDGGEAILAKLAAPVGITIDAGYNIYITDYGNNRVRRVSSTLGINGAPQFPKEISLYPSPSNGDFTVNISSCINEQSNIVILDVTGRKVNTFSINTNIPQNISVNIPDGVYLLVATTSAGTLTKKIVIAK